LDLVDLCDELGERSTAALMGDHDAATLASNSAVALQVWCQWR
jgi:hypothetical protein